MKQFTITIPNNKEAVFIDMMKRIQFIKSIEESYVSDIPEEHKNIVRERINKYKNSPESYLDWDGIDDKIKLNK